MKIVIGDARFFKGCLRAINAIVDEATFKATSEGLRLRHMDANHVAMVDFVFWKQGMDEYYLEGEDRFCLNLEELLKKSGVFKDLKKDTVIRLEKITYVPSKEFPKLSPIEITTEGFPVLPELPKSFSEKGFPKLPKTESERKREESNFLTFTLRDRMVRRFKIFLLEDSSGEDVPAPKIPFDARFVIVVEDLDRAIENLSSVSDNLKIAVSSDKIEFSAKGDLGEVNIPFDRHSESILSIETRNRDVVKAGYSTNYLKPMIADFKAISDVVSIEFSKDMPIKISPEIGHRTQLSYYLAPQIEG